MSLTVILGLCSVVAKKFGSWLKMKSRLKEGAKRLVLSVEVPIVHCALWEQGWCSGKRTRLPAVWLGFDFCMWCNMWVEFVVGSRPYTECFTLGSLVFLSQ